MKKDFWKYKKLEEFSDDEWEQICCNCGRCCLIKLQDEDNDDVFYTSIVCRYFDCGCRKCKVYEKRCELVPECLKVSPENIDKIEWMPKKCAYRILYETGNLPDWHPLLGNKTELPKMPENLVADCLVDESCWEDYIVEDEEF